MNIIRIFIYLKRKRFVSFVFSLDPTFLLSSTAGHFLSPVYFPNDFTLPWRADT